MLLRSLLAVIFHYAVSCLLLQLQLGLAVAGAYRVNVLLLNVSRYAWQAAAGYQKKTDRLRI